MITFQILWKLICVDCGYTVDLSGADLSRADLSGADLSGANLSRADLSRADLSGADLSEAENLFDPIQYLKTHFEMINLGLICYKTFHENYQPNPNWKIEQQSILTENVNPLPTNDCGCGINVATLDWVKGNCSRSNPIWKCLIPIEALCSIVVPYNTTGKIRCGMVQLLEVVNK